jgi:hypothetical protein
MIVLLNFFYQLVIRVRFSSQELEAVRVFLEQITNNTAT